METIVGTLNKVTRHSTLSMTFHPTQPAYFLHFAPAQTFLECVLEVRLNKWFYLVIVKCEYMWACKKVQIVVQKVEIIVAWAKIGILYMA